MDGERNCQKRGWLRAVPVLGRKWGISVLTGGCAMSGCRETNLELYLEVLSSLVWLSSAWISPSTKSPGTARAWELWEWLDTAEEEWERWETKGSHCWRSGCEYQGKEGWKQDVWFMRGKKKKAPGLERSRGNAVALHCTSLEEGGLRCHSVSSSAGWCPKHGLKASGSSHLLEAQSLLHTQPHPKHAPLHGWCPKLLPACAFWEGFWGETRSHVQSPPERLRCPGSCRVNTALVWNQTLPAQNPSRDNQTQLGFFKKALTPWTLQSETMTTTTTLGIRHAGPSLGIVCWSCLVSREALMQ